MKDVIPVFVLLSAPQITEMYRFPAHRGRENRCMHELNNKNKSICFFSIEDMVSSGVAGIQIKSREGPHCRGTGIPKNGTIRALVDTITTGYTMYRPQFFQ